MPKSRESYLSSLSSQEDKKNISISIEELIEEATRNPEKRELRRELAEEMKDPRDIFKQEMKEEITFIIDFIKNNSIKNRSIDDRDHFADFKDCLDYCTRNYSELAQKTLADDKNLKHIDIQQILDKATQLQLGKEFVKKIIEKNSDLSLKRQLLKLDESAYLIKTFTEQRIDLDPTNQQELEKFINFYGRYGRTFEEEGSRMETMQRQNKLFIQEFEEEATYPAIFRKISKGSYILSDIDHTIPHYCSYKRLEEVKKKLINNEYNEYFKFIARNRNCDNRKEDYPLLHYIALKTLEYDESAMVEFLSGCGDGGCGMDFSLRHTAKNSLDYINKKQKIVGSGRQEPNEELLKKIKEATGTVPRENKSRELNVNFHI